MSSLTSLTPQQATLAETGERINVTSIKLGTTIAVKAGEVVPVDGVVVEGKCEVDEKAFTGESFPVAKEIGATVWAGTINLNAVVLISAVVALFPIAVHVDNRIWWFHLALIVLVSACPCALVISTPVTNFCALSKAATIGLLFKGGDYLELLAKVNTAAFDKTGTITRGDFVVTHFQPLLQTLRADKLLFCKSQLQIEQCDFNLNPNRLIAGLNRVSSIESKSSHPMAASLVNYAIMQCIDPLPEMVDEFHNYPGEGIYGKIDGEHIYIGNHRISQRAGITENYGQESSKVHGKESGFIYVGSTLAGTFTLSDDTRTGATEAVRELKRMGIRTALLTGDNHAAAQQVQNQLEQSLDEVHAQLLPEDKARIIQDLKKEGTVAMVGDGINDALALATADIGISMGISGSALATETGHVILMSNDIRKLAQAIQLSKRASRKIIENVAISITTKGIVFALAIAGYPMLLAAVLTDVGSCLVVILNSMLLLQAGTPQYSGNKSFSKEAEYSSACGKVSKVNQSCNSGCCGAKSYEDRRSLGSECGREKSREVRGSHVEDIEKQEQMCGNGCCGSSISRTHSEGSLKKTDGETKCDNIPSCTSGNCWSPSGCAQVCGNMSLDIVIS